MYKTDPLVTKPKCLKRLGLWNNTHNFFICNLEVCYHHHKIQPFVSIISQFNPVKSLFPLCTYPNKHVRLPFIVIHEFVIDKHRKSYHLSYREYDSRLEKIQKREYDKQLQPRANLHCGVVARSGEGEWCLFLCSTSGFLENGSAWGLLTTNGTMYFRQNHRPS